MAAKALTLTRLDMDEALSAGQIRLAYQPIFSLADGALLRVEALVRWEHPRLGTMLPAVFLPAFEAENRLPALTRRVLERAAAEFGSWSLSRASGVSINLSATDLHDPTLPAAVRSVIEAVDLDPARLTFECPVLSLDPGAARPVLAGLKELGVRIAAEMMSRSEEVADAFALAPFDEVKTSGRGLLRAARNNHTATLTGAADLIAFAEARGARVTAIGAEDEAACFALRTVGFHQVQANVLAPALPIDAVTPRVTSAARQVLGFERRSTKAPLSAGDAPIEETSSFYHERRRAQGDILRRAAERRIEEAGEAALLSLRGIRAVQNVLAERYGAEAESGQVDSDRFDARDQQEALMDAESKAGLLMRPDLAAASLGYGTSPLRSLPRTTAEEARGNVAHAISDMLEALPTDVADRSVLAEEAACANPDPEDALDREVAKLPALDEHELPRPGATSPVHDELQELASKLRAEPRRKKNFLERKYKLRVTHFWPRPWKRAYLKLRERVAQSAGTQDRLETERRPRREEHAVPVVSLGANETSALTVALDDGTSPAKEGA